MNLETKITIYNFTPSVFYVDPRLSHGKRRVDIGDEPCLQSEDAHLYAEDIHLYAEDVHR